MWSREIIKENAKLALRERYWMAFAVTLLVGIITGGMGSFQNTITFRYNLGNIDSMVAFPIVSIVSVINFLFIFFVVYPFMIGKSRYFVQNRFGYTNFEVTFSGFKDGYINSCVTMFVTYLFIGLGFIIIIPGIILALKYSMVKYILADNPNLSGSRARQISSMMTNGEKGSIFVLMLSFIGWFLLGLLACGIGTLFVLPYYEATFAELYIFLRDRAIQCGMVHPAELRLVPIQPDSNNNSYQN